MYPDKANYLTLSRRADEALGAADAGLALNPNIQARGLAENSLGRYEQARADFGRAIRLSSRDPGSGFGASTWATRRSISAFSTQR